jgi:hypothetical protein
MENDNLVLWSRVEKTNPKYTKKANIKGNNITAIDPQYQILNATKEFGSYGKKWGFKDIQLDYSLMDKKFFADKIEGKYPNTKVVGKEEAVMGLVVFKAIFFYPEGQFPILNSSSIFTNNAMSKIDDQFAKKIETDALTKALSKLGFNADIFMGKFEDNRYVSLIENEFNKFTDEEIENVVLDLSKCKNANDLTLLYNSDIRIKTNKEIAALFTERNLEIQASK